MKLIFQQSALDQLQKLADKDIHSILISGISGCGKSYLAKQLAAMKSISTFHKIQPKVSDLKETIASSYQLQDEQVICIENLDKGTNASAQVILKYLEEPLPNVYVVVTAVNLSSLPDTIISRSILVNVNVPSKEELYLYGNNYNSNKNKVVSNYAIYQVCKSLNDVKTVVDMNLDQIQYYDQFLNAEIWKQSTSQIIWGLSHYPDNSPTNLSFVFRVILNNYRNSKIKQLALNALLALESGKLSESAILGKFVLGVKIN